MQDSEGCQEDPATVIFTQLVRAAEGRRINSIVNTNIPPVMHFNSSVVFDNGISSTPDELWQEDGLLGSAMRDLKRHSRLIARVASISADDDRQVIERSIPYTFDCAQSYPTKRRPALRELSLDPQDTVDDWFAGSGIHIWEGLSLSESREARRLLYTWRHMFEDDICKIKRTDLIEHAIDLTPDARPYRAKVPLWTQQEIAFSAGLIPNMEKSSVILRIDGPWGHRTKYPLRNPSKPQNGLRMVHNYIPLNRYTVASSYPCKRIDQIVHTVVRPTFKYYFWSDASNAYWAIPLRKGDEMKTGFITPDGQYCYTVMGQGLKTACNTYSRFRDICFGHIPEGRTDDGSSIPGFRSIIGDHGSTAFDGLIDDSYGGAETFSDMVDFLHTKFFPRCEFGPHYLKPSKSFFFFPSLEFVGLVASIDGIRPSLQKREMILQWPTPTSQQEVDAFCYLTPYLRRFIPGRAELVRIMKGESDPDRKDSSDRKDPPVDINNPTWQWTPEKDRAFRAVKQAIANNAMASADSRHQFHLACDASKRATGAVLFQLPGIPALTEAASSEEHRAKERMIMFMSFRLTDAESRYSNSEREALAIMRGLAEVRWLVMGSPWPVFVYTDHEALKTLVVGVDNDSHGRIARWQDRLGEYDVQLFHRRADVHFMGIADGLSRLPTRLQQRVFVEDTERPVPRVMDAAASGPVRRVDLIPACGFVFSNPPDASHASSLRSCRGFWSTGNDVADKAVWRSVGDVRSAGFVAEEKVRDVKGEEVVAELAVANQRRGEIVEEQMARSGDGVAEQVGDGGRGEFVAERVPEEEGDVRDVVTEQLAGSVNVVAEQMVRGGDVVAAQEVQERTGDVAADRVSGGTVTVHPVFRTVDFVGWGEKIPVPVVKGDVEWTVSQDIVGGLESTDRAWRDDRGLLSPITRVGSYGFAGDWFSGMHAWSEDVGQEAVRKAGLVRVGMGSGSREDMAGGGSKVGEGKMSEDLGVEVVREGTEEERLRVRARWQLLCGKWRKWLESPFYRLIVLYLLGGLKALVDEDVGRNNIRRIQRESQRYVLGESSSESRLFYREKNGELATCITEADVVPALGRLHDNHGHFSHGITTNNAVGKVYWPTRSMDVQRWIRQCDACQRVSKLQKSDVYNPVVQFKPFDMMGIDYIGPISPACGSTGCRYIIMAIDYFTRFVFARPCRNADQATTMEFLCDHIVPIFGWPKIIYSDNGGHFVGEDARNLLKAHGVVQISAPISHPESVGLAERYVNMIMGRIRTYSISERNARNWSLYVLRAAIDINTRMVKLHGFTPAELLLGFNPMSSRSDDHSGRGWLLDEEQAEAVLHAEIWQLTSHWTTREDRQRSATQRLVTSQDSTTKKASSGFVAPKAGDLVIMKDFGWFQQKGRKLDPRWKHSHKAYNIPFIVEKLSKNGSSAYIRGPHDPPGHTKRIHISDLRVYRPRNLDEFPSAPPAVHYARDCFAGVPPGSLGTGTKALDLSDLM
jgi:hypothetical protein